jgi:hypothetical protein
MKNRGQVAYYLIFHLWVSCMLLILTLRFRCKSYPAHILIVIIHIFGEISFLPSKILALPFWSSVLFCIPFWPLLLILWLTVLNMRRNDQYVTRFEFILNIYTWLYSSKKIKSMFNFFFFAVRGVGRLLLFLWTVQPTKIIMDTVAEHIL